ncbi:hypothetical protein ACSBR2_027239 [Camellia fascicularis]
MKKKKQDYRLLGYVESNPPLPYFQSRLYVINYVKYDNGSFNGQNIPLASSSGQFMRLDPDGHLKIYESGELNWNAVVDLLTSVIGDCGYPMVCSNYDKNSFLDEKIDLEDCKKSCLKNCSCKAALFAYDSRKGCLLLSVVFSLINNEGRVVNVTVFLKVQKSLTAPTNSPLMKSRQVTITLGSSLRTFFGEFFVVSSCFFLLTKKRESEELDEFFVDQVLGSPTRVSYEELRVMTSNFNDKLGEGGFGTVFHRTLSDGNIHHVNLVRLVGFCAEKSYRVLVYEYMSNGSMDKWIFQRHQEMTLGWKSRKKIIMDIAKGLTYLHEECRQKIFHLDIKPQNILLDEHFNAKISDFGLSKLIDKDQSQVVTMMKGTPGYLAPEWLSSIITEKVDVYSFGVVVLEMLCGRKILDRSQPEEDMRTSMSVVVKVLEGFVDVENNLDYNITTLVVPRAITATGHQEDAIGDATPLFPSALLGPR